MKEIDVSAGTDEEAGRELADLKREAQALGRIIGSTDLLDEHARQAFAAPLGRWIQDLNRSVLPDLKTVSEHLIASLPDLSTISEQLNTALLPDLTTVSQHFIASQIPDLTTIIEQLNKSVFGPIVVWDQELRDRARLMAERVTADVSAAVRSASAMEGALQDYLNRETRAEPDFSHIGLPEGPTPARSLTTDEKFVLLIIVAWVLAVAGAISRAEAIGLTGTAIAAWDFYSKRAGD